MAKKETITRNEYLQLLGLGVIARGHYKGVEEARDAMLSVLGMTQEEDDNGGWVNDTVWDDACDVDRMLKMMEITVEEEANEVRSEHVS